MSLRRSVVVGWASLALLSHLFAVGAGWQLAERRWRKPVLIVNGEPLDYRELDRVNMLFRSDAFGILSAQHVVEQLARFHKVNLGTDEVPVGDLQDLDAPLKEALIRERRAELLLRKLVLREVPEEERRRVFDEFRSELRHYGLGFIFLNEATDMDTLQEEIDAKKPFSVLEEHFGRPVPSILDAKLLKKPLRIEFLWEWLDPEDVVKIRSATPGTLLGPLTSRVGPLLVEVRESYDDYETVKPALEDLLFQARRNLFLHQLGQKSTVQSLMPMYRVVNNGKAIEPLKQVPLDLRGGMLPPELPTPKASATPGPLPTTLPRPDPAATALPGLPDPKLMTPGPTPTPSLSQPRDSGNQ